MYQIGLPIEKKKKLFSKLRTGSKRHKLIAEMRGKWSSIIVDEAVKRGKCLLSIDNVECREDHLVGKADLAYLLQYADERESLGAMDYRYHFTKMNF